jgi:HNH endonuclease
MALHGGPVSANDQSPSGGCPGSGHGSFARIPNPRLAIVIRPEGFVVTELTVERVRELLDYDPETGVFTWRFGRRKAKKGAIAGSYTADGYQRICVDRGRYLAHRLAWLITYGVLPPDETDHINGIRDDNRMANLRLATKTLNMENMRRPRIDNTTGILGVSWNKRAKKFRSLIRFAGKNLHLGYFTDPAEAHQAYLTAKRQLHSGCTI